MCTCWREGSGSRQERAEKDPRTDSAGECGREGSVSGVDVEWQGRAEVRAVVVAVDAKREAEIF